MNELVNQYGNPGFRSGDTPLDSNGAENAIRKLIAESELKPGDRLPPERDLKDRFGISRGALRKALETLEREGAIWRHVGKGTFVSATSGETAGTNLIELSRKVSPLHMMRARLSLEPAIAREAAINASDLDVARIKSAQQEACAADSWDTYETWDDALHRTIAEATGNSLLLALFDQLNQVRRAVAWNTVVRASVRPPRDHTSFTEHDRIVSAIEARSAAEAHEAMRAHLGSVSGRLFGDA